MSLQGRCRGAAHIHFSHLLINESYPNPSMQLAWEPNVTEVMVFKEQRFGAWDIKEGALNIKVKI